MKKIFTLFSACICAMSMFALTYNVTVPTGTKACYIAGEMNGWSQVEMTKVDDTHYTIDVADATDAMKYKYCSGPGWAYVEKTASGDEVADRTYSAADVVEAWASVYDPTNVPDPGETKDITVKAKVPAEWTNQITAWVWPTGGEGTEVVPTQDGEWYVVTHNCAELNIIYKNGAGWNGDANQTVDMTFTENTCIVITAGAGKATYTVADCEGGETPEPSTGVTYNVTVPAGTNACYIAGELNGWSQTEMTKVDDTHYTLTVADATTAMKYKYCSGPSWDYVEMQADGVTDVQDRTYSENDVVEAWKAVYAPGEEPGEEPGEDPEPSIGVTYNVTVPAGTNACYIAGELNGWSQTEMTKVDDTHYTLTVADATTAMKYKYCSGPSWDYVEMQADGVTNVQDRTYSENDVVEAWKAVYAPGEEPGEEPGEDPEPSTGVTYNVTVPAGTNACYIAGELNGWSQTEMTKIDDTHYTLTVADATTAMKYKYCSGPSWDYVEMQADGVTDVQDRTYSENDVVEAWKAVYAPGEEPGEEPGEDPEPSIGVTYNVTVPAGTNACYIAGELNGWSQTEMTKVDDTHYTLTVADATTAMKYKYCSGPSWDYVEMQADGVTDVQDRTYSENDVVEAWKAVYAPGEEPGEDPIDPNPGETKDITVKAKVPAEWTNQITAWVWPTGGEGTEVVPTQDGEWYVVTHNCAELNIIYKNGAGWNGDANQTVDMTFTENTCIVITAGAGKATYELVDCDSNTAVENVDATNKNVKFVYNGQLVVRHNDKLYNVMGQEVK